MKPACEYTDKEIDNLDENEKILIRSLSSKFNDTSIIICMANNARLSRLSKIIDGNQLLLHSSDEADVTAETGNDPTRKYNKYFKIINQNANMSIFCSATQAKFWLDKDMKVNYIIQIPPHPAYVGVDKFTMNPSLGDKPPASIIHTRSIFSQISLLKNVIKDTCKINHYPVTNRITGESYNLTRAVGVIVSPYISHHNDIFNYIKDTDDIKENRTAIVWNGGELIGDAKTKSGRIKIALPENSSERFITIEIEKDGRFETARKNSDGYYSFNDISIEHVLTYLRTLGYEKTGTIFPIMGNMASRAASIVGIKYHQHLTDQILGYQPTAWSSLRQLLRLCGTYFYHYGQFPANFWSYKSTNDDIITSTAIDRKLAIVGSLIYNNDTTLNKELDKGNVKMPLVMKNVKAYNTKKKKCNTRFMVKNFSNDARDEVNLHANLKDFKTLDKAHSDMYKLGANPGLKFRANVRKQRETINKEQDKLKTEEDRKIYTDQLKIEFKKRQENGVNEDYKMALEKWKRLEHWNNKEEEDKLYTKQFKDMKNAYNRKDSKVRLIIDLFCKDGIHGSLSKTEICNSHPLLKNINITNYDRWEDGRSAKYNILSKTPSGKYILREEIYEYLYNN